MAAQPPIQQSQPVAPAEPEGRPLEVTEVTGTDKGLKAVESRRAFIEEARSKGELGNRPVKDSDEARQFEVGDGDAMVVAPAWFKVIGATVTEDGAIEIASEVDASRIPKETVNGRAINSFAYWTTDSEGCPYVTYSHNNRFLSCLRQQKLAADGNSSYDYWSYHTWGTAFSVPGGKVVEAYIRIQKASGSAAMSLLDYQPRSSSTGSCFTYSLSVGLGGSLPASLTTNHQRCETWQPFFMGSGTDPIFENRWKGDARNGNSREVALGQSIRTPEWTYPMWYLTIRFKGCEIQTWWPDDCGWAYAP